MFSTGQIGDRATRFRGTWAKTQRRPRSVTNWLEHVTPSCAQKPFKHCRSARAIACVDAVFIRPMISISETNCVPLPQYLVGSKHVSQWLHDLEGDRGARFRQPPESCHSCHVMKFFERLIVEFRNSANCL